MYDKSPDSNVMYVRTTAVVEPRTPWGILKYCVRCLRIISLGWVSRRLFPIWTQSQPTIYFSLWWKSGPTNRRLYPTPEYFFPWVGLALGWRLRRFQNRICLPTQQTAANRQHPTGVMKCLKRPDTEFQATWSPNARMQQKKWKSSPSPDKTFFCRGILTYWPLCDLLHPKITSN